jgi:hypothetical protein
MTIDEKEALLTYLEYNLLSMVEQISEQYPQLDAGQIGTLYKRSYVEVVNEMERTLTDRISDQTLTL